MRMEKSKKLKPRIHRIIDHLAKNDLQRNLLINYAKDARDCFLTADYSKVQKKDDLFQKSRNENPKIENFLRSDIESLIIAGYGNEAYTYHDDGYMMEICNEKTGEMEVLNSQEIYDFAGNRISKDFGEHYLSRNVYEGDSELNERMYEDLKNKAQWQYIWYERSPADREIKPFKESVKVKIENGRIY
ncbi:hypothetical protein ERICIII_04842 (plasmid) [Paenibacillus larvae subsp. larvae]|uniref:Uncharacterized protein n=2 Tax=Paenibacillus larvae TaxID=1464 RepID=A0A2L1U7E1_9BACL|nr:hypothetical protein ERICIII_04842 [Paenibacillus larvae subsp. larvae]